MGFTPEIATIRFGEGLAPDQDLPGSVEAVMGQLSGPDTAAADHPIPTFSTILPELAGIERIRKTYRQARGGDGAEAARKAYKKASRAAIFDHIGHHQNFLARSFTTDTPFRERLTRFWADHFTVVGKDRITRLTVPHYIEEAIRPHIAGRFSDMLKAVISHPLMLLYLDQTASFGPNSRAARGRRGLNENLAREVLELHTLGVGGAYQQGDVRQLAELFTGLTASADHGFRFRPARAEPGPETVLGQSYGGLGRGLDDIYAALDDLAVHPDTARHIAQKLAVHFTSDTPDPQMIAQMAEAYLGSRGDLTATYDVMLSHPFAWNSFGQKVKQPIDLMISGLRALGLPGQSITGLSPRKVQSYISGPLLAMGQPFFRPQGPDGWPEDAAAWVSPQGLAARLQWSMAAPQAFFRALPDPRGFAQTALGPFVDARLEFAVGAAETRREGVGLVLASPAFQRR